MKRFVELYLALDATTRTNEKVAAIEAYLHEAPRADAAWAVWFLAGNRVRRAFSGPRLRDWIAQVTGLPRWLISESYDAVGDLGETISLLVPEVDRDFDEPLHMTVRDRILPLARAGDDERRAIFEAAWRVMPPDACFVWLKMVTGAFRVGVQRTLLARAMAGVAGVDSAVMAHRLMAGMEPTADGLDRLLAPAGEDRPGDALTPYPFFLASAPDRPVDTFGAADDWGFEWKWDGIRAQLVRRGGAVMLWSRGEEVLDDTFPELSGIGRALPDGTVLDGEILAWDHGGPLPFTSLQRRLGRKQVELMLFADVPVRLVAFDLLEVGGEDLRPRPIEERRERLLDLVAAVAPDEPLGISAWLDVSDWDAAATIREGSRAVGAEGLMIKRRGSAYQVGRPRGDWWKWKVDPFTVDAVLVHAQRGSGRRASLLTDYTFAVWDGDELVPVAKAYSGLTDDEIKAVDTHLRGSTLERRGGFRTVRPELVFELAFEGIQSSDRHRSGIALRFPRMHRWRMDKAPADADTIEALREILTSERAHVAARQGGTP
ncbi:MAG: ATP-dependent DNA ligase [Phycisphaerales bacterium]